MSSNNFALLATASYSRFTNINNDEDIRDALIKEIPNEYITHFTETYKIIAHQPNTASGYSGTIVKNRHSGEYFMLHRGTENRY